MGHFGRAVPRAYSAVAGLSSIGPFSVCNIHNSRYHYRQWAIWCNSRRTELRNADNCRQRYWRIVSCALLHCMRINTRPIWSFASSNSVQRHTSRPSIIALRKVHSVASSARLPTRSGLDLPRLCPVERYAVEDPGHGHRRVLCTCRKWPNNCDSAKHRYELPSSNTDCHAPRPQRDHARPKRGRVSRPHRQVCDHFTIVRQRKGRPFCCGCMRGRGHAMTPS
jgi:hypothetical protein